MPNSIFENAYYKMPIAAQNAIFSAYGWHLSRLRYNHYFQNHLQNLKKMEWWSSSEIEDYQNKCFVEVVRHAYKTVPFYRQWYDELQRSSSGKIKAVISEIVEE